jgi:hypothetical protein
MYVKLGRGMQAFVCVSDQIVVRCYTSTSGFDRVALCAGFQSSAGEMWAMCCRIIILARCQSTMYVMQWLTPPVCINTTIGPYSTASSCVAAVPCPEVSFFAMPWRLLWRLIMIG